MTPFEKILLGLVGLYLLSHAMLKWGQQLGVSATVIELAESLVTGF